MNIQTDISYQRVIITEPTIEDVYYIEKNSDTGLFYVYSSNGLNGRDYEEFKELAGAISRVKKSIKHYFIDRCEPTPKGW
jgi:hypothetical protein